jgi:hypothetical protein
MADKDEVKAKVIDILRGAQPVKSKFDIISDILASVHEAADLDQAIDQAHTHHDKLQRRIGWIDARIFLVIIIAFTFMEGIKRLDALSIALFALDGILVVCGIKIQSAITRIKTEMAATNMLLMELYKQKITRQIDKSLGIKPPALSS